jgi:hypothetical protein
MSIAAEILSLRRNQQSSVKMLIAALDWQEAALDDVHILGRGLAVLEAADAVLLNVAAHAAAALGEPPVARKARRSVLALWRKRRRRFDPSHSAQQRRRFA